MKKRLILAGLLALAVASCGKHGAEHHDGQVVADVNGHKITVLEVNSILGHMGTMSKAQSQQVADGVLKNLVNQELLAQQAVKQKLDRNPQVLQAILESRKQILAQAYMGRRFASLAPPTNGAIATFYNNHPDLFAHRQIYRVETILIQDGQSKMAAIKRGLAASKTPQAFLAWLKTQGLPFHAGVVVRTAEQVPFAMLHQLSQMKAGQTIVGNSGANLVVLVLLGKQDQPETLVQAKQAIKHFLINRSRQKMLQSTLQTLRSSAKIKYYGRYASAGKTTSLTPSSVKALTAGAAKTKGSATDQALKKGISGLQ